MTYATLMVQLDLGHSNTGLLQIAGDLAERFKAHVIGVAACKPMQFVYGEGYVAGDVVDADRKQIDAEMGKAEAEFRNALKRHAESLEWRSIRLFSGLSDEIASEACGADLVITNMAPNSILDVPRRADISDLVMQAGRPVLIVPQRENPEPGLRTAGLERYARDTARRS